MDKITKKKNEKYTKILDTALGLFEKNGTHLVSIDEIVKGAGVAKGTFYLYFKDRYDLISTLIIEKASKYMSLLSDEYEPRNFGDVSTSVRHYIEYISDFLQKNKTLCILIEKNLNTCVNAVAQTKEGPIKELYEKIFSELINCGVSEAEARAKLYLYIELIVSSCCNAIIRETPYTIEELKPHLCQIIESSIVNIIKR
ncbi:MAG: TetR/AcrR family transcriptional regulator [Candidatus Fimenecus sp.]|nr:TetR/AcrR family transcriptional regulator [Ruminococcus sp.]MDY6059809.1 TetR/AcrR family transcriptional regulator [Candidatus Fimenecus sp.]